MSKRISKFLLMILPILILAGCGAADSEQLESSPIETVALWLFDEPAGLYPSSTLDDSSDNDMPLALGMGGQVVDGHFGRVFLLEDREPFTVPVGEENHERFGFVKMQPAEGRTVEPMTWFNAQFAALMTSGETHLRKEVGFVNPSDSGLNLGDFDWSVEFWHSQPEPAMQDTDSSVIFELGSGPRGENDIVTKLSRRNSQFVLINQSSGATLDIPSAAPATSWHHYAFTYDAAAAQLRHYVDGKMQPLPE